MIPVMCNCANNKAGVCYGKANTINIADVMENKISDEAKALGKTAVTGCPGYIPIGEPAYEGVAQGDRKFGKDGQTKAY